MPWGDGHTPSGDNGEQHDFALMDRDLEDSNEHAQFRNYSTILGRWLSPDPYLGSYDFSNPQTFNRYAYALNNPVANVDPSGLETCYEVSGSTWSVASEGGYSYGSDPGETICTGDPPY